MCANISAVTDIKSEIQRQYPKQFTGVGKLNTKQITLHINESVAPVAQPLEMCAIPPRWKSSGEKDKSAAVEKKISPFLAADLTAKVKEPTPWVNPIVAAPKAAEDDARMCFDMRRANAAIMTQWSTKET